MKLKLRVSREFGKRKVASGSRELNPFYLISIVGEGVSEERYFKGLRDYLSEIGNDQMIKIEVLEKTTEYESMGHPIHLLDLLNERAIKWNEWGIESNELWMIIDRDSQDRGEEQLKDILDNCKSRGYQIALTNPAFELWLLLHLTELDGYDRELLYQNKKIGKRRFLEKELSRLLGGYSKSSLDFEDYKDGLTEALERARRMENRNEELLQSLGTSINILVNTFIY